MVPEEDRLKTLRSLNLLDTMPEKDYDDLVQAASGICNTPISLISFLDEHRQWIKTGIGFPESELPRKDTFCNHTIQQTEMLVVEDARMDARFSENVYVKAESGIRFYAGVPLKAPNGHMVGTLCVADTVPHELTASQRELMRILGRQIEARIELRLEQSALQEAKRANERLSASLRESENLFRAFTNHGPFLSYIKDAEGRFVFYNDQFAEQFAIDRDEWLGKTDMDVFDPHLAERLRENDLMVLEAGEPMELAEVTLGPNEELTHWVSHKFPFCTEDGKLMIAGMSLNVTAELQRQHSLDRLLVEKDALAKNLEASHSLFHAFMNNSPVLAFLKSSDGRYVFYNRHFAELFGIDQLEWLGKSDGDVLDHETAESIRRNEMYLLETGEQTEQVNKLPTRNGEIRCFKLVKFTYKGADGMVMIAGVATDVTDEMNREHELREANRRLDALAATDPLTGLPNRRAFEQRISREFSNALRTRRPMSVMVLDIDNFKRRNDEMGHAAGDVAIQLVGKVLTECGRLSDMPARVGGEEFCFLMPETTVQGAMQLARRIQRELRKRAVGRLPLTVSIGIARINRTTKTWERLVACADDAMYEAKRIGKDCIVTHHEHVMALLSDAAHKSGIRPMCSLGSGPSEALETTGQPSRERRRRVEIQEGMDESGERPAERPKVFAQSPAA